MKHTQKEWKKANLNSEVKELKNENKYLYELLKLSKKKMFGKSGEQIAKNYGQISLFNEAETDRTVLEPEPKIEEVIYDIPEEEKVCKNAEKSLHF